jgi:hypothetical protein
MSEHQNPTQRRRGRRGRRENQYERKNRIVVPAYGFGHAQLKAKKPKSQRRGAEDAEGAENDNREINGVMVN